MNRIQGISICTGMLLASAGAASGQCWQTCDEPMTRTTAMRASYQTRPADIVDTAVAAGNFKTLAAALQAAGLVETLKGKGPFTVFAPTDDAFAKLPPGTVENLLKPENRDTLKAILTYHVAPGNVMAAKVVKMDYAGTVNGQRVDIAVKSGNVMLDGRAKVTATDIECTNGVIHVIDTVIMPSTKNVIQTASEAGSFKTLLAALDAAGLTGALEGKGPFTVFAPTDEAFANLPPGTVENLLKPENRNQLTSILTYHVIPGRVYADQVVSMKESAKTLQGSTFMIMAKGGKVEIGNAKAMATVVTTDLETANGVIHVIDAVIMPK